MEKKKSMWFIKIAGFVVSISFICACGKAVNNNKYSEETGVTDDSILIGVSAALTGPAASLGQQLIRGSLAYIKNINDTGGIAGREIRLVILDDGYNPQRTLHNTRRLIDKDKVFMLFDYVGTPTAKVILKMVDERKIPLLAPFTGAEFLRNPLQEYVFNIRASYYTEIGHMVDTLVSAGKTKIAVFMQNDAFGATILLGARLALARYKLDIITRSRFTRGELPTVSAVQKIVKARPEAIIMGGTSRSLARFVKMAKDRGLVHARFYTVSFVGSETFAKDLKRMGRGVAHNVFVSQVVPSPHSNTVKVVTEFREMFKAYYPKTIPNYVALEGFINAKILVEAFKRCGKKLNRQRLMKTLLGMRNYDPGLGVLPKINLYNHSFYNTVYISTIKSGKFEVTE